MKKKVLATLAIVAVLGLTACQKETNEAPEATPTVEAVKEQKLTNTPSLEPSVTLTPTPEPTSTPTPVPTSTPTPEPTSTPMPTVPPTVYAEGVNFVTGFKRADDVFAVSNGVFLVGDEGYFRAMNSEKEYIKKGTFFAYGTVENDCYFLAHGGEIEEGVFTAYEQAVLSDIQGNVLGTILHDSGLTVFAEEKIVYCDRFDDTVLNIFDLPTQEVTSVSIIDESTGAQYSVLSMSNFYDEKLYLAAANFDINKSVLAELSYDGSYNILPNFENTDIEYFSLDGDTHNDCAAFSGNSYDGSKIIGLTNVKNGSSILLRTEDLFNEEVYNYSVITTTSCGKEYGNYAGCIVAKLQTASNEAYYLLDFNKAVVDDNSYVTNPKELIVAKYDYISASDNGYYLAAQNEEYFLLDRSGNVYSDYLDCSEFCNGYALVIEEDNLAYLIDENFQKVSTGFPAVTVYRISDALVAVTQNYECTYFIFE